MRIIAINAIAIVGLIILSLYGLNVASVDTEQPCVDENIGGSRTSSRNVDISCTERDLEVTPNLEGDKASVDYSILIINMVDYWDSFTIIVQVDNLYRNWFYFPAETTPIAPSGSQTVIITVEVPNGREAETFGFDVNVTSKANNSRYDTETFTLKILQAYGVHLEAKDNVNHKSLDTDSSEVENDRVVIFEIELINIGTDTDNYEITPIESKYSKYATVSPAEILNLVSEQSKSVTVTVKVPKDTPICDIKLTIKAISRGDDVRYDTNDANDTQDLWISVTQIYDVDVSTPTTSKSGVLGELVQFDFTVKNRGNGDDSILLKLEDKGDWPWTLSTSAPTLQPAGSDGDSKDITLSVVIPKDAEVKSSGYTVNLIMISDTPEGDVVHIARGDLEFTVFVDQEYAINMSVTKNRLDGDPGDTVYFRIKVKNNGNGYDKFDFETSIEKSQENIMPALETYLSTYEVTLPPFEFTYIWLNVSIPDIDEVKYLEDIKAGDYNIKVTARSRGEEIENILDLYVRIKKDYKLEVEPEKSYSADNPLEAHAADPEGVGFYITVTNKGNANDSAILGALDNNPDYWIFNFYIYNEPNQTIYLEPGESQRILVRVTFDKSAGSGIDYAGITAKSTKNSAKYGISFGDRVYINVKTYQLKISDLEFSNPNPDVGENINITASIDNVGKGDAVNIVVTFKDKNEILEVKEIDLIEAGSNVTVQIEWNATAGDHEIIVEVEQFDGTNTSLNKPISIVDDEDTDSSEKTESQDSSKSGLIISGMAVIIVILLIIIFYLLMERRPKKVPVRKPTSATKFTPACPKCNNDLIYLDKFEKWYCDTCKSYKKNT
ncbi:MAG: hypothetical protein JSV49_02310 [Thermoplasmata archaeon]|nr:MAG: hypothetical protein JSV49_02310 [Thermoplasmata archaeon]